MESDIPLQKKNKICEKKMFIVLEKIEGTWKWQFKASMFEQVS
jgi:hypothetical protein